ncbi:hypothetical protein AY599_09080 [Leptolyngbya valderiana BDU 20041]|nr:hypothetical protein AY599_09080 [Leptolyngbya valderiana BDU 20041]
MDTASIIVAPATPMAPGRRAVVRLSGIGVFDAVDALATSPIDRSRGVGPVRLRLPVGELPTLAVRLSGPHSYTGEDTIEIFLPGSPTVVTALVRALIAQPGVRHAEAGEFSARAYLNGRLSLEQAEGVAATIAASTDAQLEASHRLLSGQSGRRYAAMVDQLASLLALVEAAADFSEEEHVVPIAAGTLHARLQTLHDALHREMTGRSGKESLSARPLVVLAGAPNAGKTSLFNALLGRTRSVVSSIEHATRDAVVEPLRLEHPDLGAIECELADLPGLQDQSIALLADDEQASVQSVIDAAMEQADLVLLCDPEARYDSIGTGHATIRLRTKADAVGVDAAGAMAVSVRTGLNLDSLRLAIAEALDQARQDVNAGLLPRHHALATTALHSLHRAIESVSDDPPEGLPAEGELVAAEMRLALDALGELGGKVSPDEVLGRIFASFCVGK